MVAALLPIVATDADDEAVEVRFMSAGDVDLLLLLPLSPGAVPRAVDRHASGMSRLLLQASTTVGAGEAVAIVDTGDASAAVVVAVVSEAEMAKTAGEAGTFTAATWLTVAGGGVGVASGRMGLATASASVAVSVSSEIEPGSAMGAPGA
ncbi:hypothetical protein CXG81DRAFT_21553, partial [Caulochytrium protostelioides]